ncbi:MAG TPA: AraC family transcriptional regulator [Acidobacteriota bacterium]|nr:AraC family transcriptional regulator [Acidobacteriota bacterium]
MNPVYERLQQMEPDGFRIRIMEGDSFSCSWHLHPENELTLVLDGSGHRMIGDNISPFESVDLVLIGTNLPHDFYIQNLPGHQMRVIVIHFSDDFLGPGFFNQRLLEPVKRLLQRARVGLAIRGEQKRQVIERMSEVRPDDKLEGVIALLEMLEILTTAEVEPLSSYGFAPEFTEFDHGQLKKICQYVLENLDRKIYLHEVAAQLGLTEGSFSRYFKSRTGKTFTEFVNELRVGRACRMLTEEGRKITDIAFASGFENLSHFNRQFRKIKSMCPREYRDAATQIWTG